MKVEEMDLLPEHNSVDGFRESNRKSSKQRERERESKREFVTFSLAPRAFDNAIVYLVTYLGIGILF